MRVSRKIYPARHVLRDEENSAHALSATHTNMICVSQVTAFLKIFFTVRRLAFLAKELKEVVKH